MNPLSLGHYDKAGHACLKLHLRGVRHPAPGVEYEVMIDTGFSGFIQIPIVQAIALQLPLQGTQTLVLANGETVSTFTAMVVATFGEKAHVGAASLTPSDIFLVGMGFLRQFDQALIISKDGIGLMDEQAPAESTPPSTE